jgi:anti-sigma B factor antagonist
MDVHTRTLTAPRRGAPMELREERLAPERRLLAVTGEVDVASAPDLKLALLALIEEPDLAEIVLDASGITHLDSTGLAVLIGVRRRLPAGRRLLLAAPAEAVVRLLELTGMTGVFDAVDSVSDAVAYLDATAGSQDETPLSPDAALVLGLAGTALPFAGSPAEEAQSWLRILLPYGCSMLIEDELPLAPPVEVAPAAGPRDRLDRVLQAATRAARARAASTVRTGDVLRGVVAVYGPAFERALRAHHEAQQA